MIEVLPDIFVLLLSSRLPELRFLAETTKRVIDENFL